MARLLAIGDGRTGAADPLAIMGLGGVDQIGIDHGAGGDGFAKRGFQRLRGGLVRRDQGLRAKRATSRFRVK